MRTYPPVIVDLEMSDEEYLQLLAQGRDPIQQQRNQSYESVLLQYGIAAVQAREVAPLFDKLDCSIAERIQINQALKHIWNCLIGRPA